MVARVLALLGTIFGSSLLLTTIYALGSGCRPGTFVNNIVLGCQTCPNRTFSDKYNATKCSICKECFGKRNKIAQACTLTSNTICKCQDGFYFNDFLYCLKCKPCKRRHGVKQNCSATSDTVCERCEKGKTFSTEKSLERCKPCTRCPTGHIVQSNGNCTRRTDTVCVPERDINDSKNWKIKVTTASSTTTTTATATNRTTTTTTTTKKKRWETSPKSPLTASSYVQNVTQPKPVDPVATTSTTWLQIILYGIVGLLVILIIALGLVCWRKKKRPRKVVRKPGNCDEPSTRTNSTEIIEAVENPYSSLPFISGRQGTEKMLRDVAYTLINDLAQDLNPQNRWKQLGGYLNFDSTQIGNFAIDGQNATQTMLQEWGQKDGATVVALQRTFGSMKWRKEERMVGKYV